MREASKNKNPLTYIIKVAMVELVAENAIKIFQYKPGSERILQTIRLL